MTTTTATEEQNTTTQTQPTPDLNQITVLLSLSFKTIGRWRRVESERVRVQADKKRIKVRKDLYQSKALTDLISFDDGVRQWITSICLPSRFLRGGTYRIPDELIAEVDEKMLYFQEQRDERVDRFIETYEEVRAEAQAALGELFNPLDYQPVASVKEQFSMEWAWAEAGGVPGRLRHVSSRMLRREQEKAQEQVRQEAGEIRQAIRQSFADLIDFAAGRLDSQEVEEEVENEDGTKTKVTKKKKMIFRDSMVERVGAFLSTFSARNVMGDTEMDALVKKARAVMEGVDGAQALRDDDDLRERVRSALTGIRDEMEQNLRVRPKRAISLED